MKQVQQKGASWGWEYFVSASGIVGALIIMASVAVMEISGNWQFKTWLPGAFLLAMVLVYAVPKVVRAISPRFADKCREWAERESIT